jgi:hypothetical protein
MPISPDYLQRAISESVERGKDARRSFVALHVRDEPEKKNSPKQ